MKRAAPALSLSDVELEARARLDPAVYDFCAGGADDEITLCANEAAFRRLGLLPRVLRGPGQPDLSVDLLGVGARFPVLIAPTAFHRLFHPDGERATARAAVSADTILIASLASTVAIEDVARTARDASGGAPPKLWFQLNVQPDLAFTEHLVRRAEAAGARALVVSVDAPVFGRRRRDLRHGFTDLPPGLRCENLREPGPTTEEAPVRSIAFWPELSWEHIGWLRSITALPIVLKGVVRPDDARLAVNHGAAALIVSNHGGRQLDSEVATIDALPAIADRVAGSVPVLMDGGIRRGTDVLKALALGANAVLIGRPYLWGLAAAGERGVRRVLDLLCAELELAMGLCGCRTVEEISSSLVVPR